MNQLIIHIHERTVRALVYQDGAPGFARSYEYVSSEMAADDEAVKSPTALQLPEILKAIRLECGCSVNETHLILPPEDFLTSHHTTPKIPRGDAEKIISRKISAETKEEFPSFSIMPASSDQKSQTWTALYVPGATLNRYHKTFASAKLKLKSVTTATNAMMDAFKTVREAIFNAHAIFEIVGGYVEAYYITSEGMLLNERLAYIPTANTSEIVEVDPDKSLKQLLFKIINTIFRINSHYQAENSQTPVQLAWVCGDVSGLDEIATALKEAMSIEVAIAPPISNGMDNESAFVPLAGYVAAFQAGSAVTYSVVPFLRRFPVRKTYGVILYAVVSALAFLAFFLTEKEYRALKKQVSNYSLQNSKTSSKAKSPQLKNLEQLKKLTANQMVFYPLFRELANELPDGVFLENIDYKFKDDKGVVVITALAPLESKLFKTDFPSRIMALFDRSAVLQNHREPVISTVSKDNKNFLKLTFTSEVKAVDTTK